MTNSDLIREYLKGTKNWNVSGHLFYIENELVNYSTVLCRINREKKRAVFNVTKYSRTTSKIQSKIHHLLSIENYEIMEVEYAGYFYPWNAGFQGAENWTRKEIEEKYKRIQESRKYYVKNSEPKYRWTDEDIWLGIASVF